MRRALLVCTILALAAPVASFAGTYYLVATTIQGANTKIDIQATSTWTFSPSVSFDLGGGALVMKDEPSTSDNLTLTLHDLTTQIAVQAISMTNPQFKAQVDTTGNGKNNDQSYNPEYIFFGATSFSYQNVVSPVSPYTLTAGHSYSLQLTSLAPSNGSSAYFIKGGTTSSTFGFVTDPSCTSGGTACSGDPTLLNQTVNPVYNSPEPATVAELGIGTLLMVFGWRRRRKTR